MAKKTPAKFSFKTLQQFIKDNQTWVIASAAILVVLAVAIITKPDMFGIGAAGKVFAYPPSYDPNTEAYYACCWDGPDADNWPDWRARDCWKHNMRKCEAWRPRTERAACEIMCAREGYDHAEIENCEAAGTCQRRRGDHSNSRCHCYSENQTGNDTNGGQGNQTGNQTNGGQGNQTGNDTSVTARWDCDNLGGGKGWGYKRTNGAILPIEFDGHRWDDSGGRMIKNDTGCTYNYTCYLNANDGRKFDDGLWCSRNQPDIWCECYR